MDRERARKPDQILASGNRAQIAGEILQRLEGSWPRGWCIEFVVVRVGRGHRRYTGRRAVANPGRMARVIEALSAASAASLQKEFLLRLVILVVQSCGQNTGIGGESLYEAQLRAQPEDGAAYPAPSS